MAIKRGIPNTAATATMMMPRISGTAEKGDLGLAVVSGVSVLSGKSFTNLLVVGFAVGLVVGLPLTFGEGETFSLIVTCGVTVTVALLVAGLVVGRAVGVTASSSVKPPVPVPLSLTGVARRVGRGG